MQFHCPIDAQPLSQESGVMKCPSGHSFDLAKEGYCNLLLVQQKATLDPGDNKEMVEARRRFLSAGHFDPIAEKIVELTNSQSAHEKRLRILDAGCGEGYYLSHLARSLPDADLSGIDISKWAVRAAAKNHKNISWAVASNKQLPLAMHSLDLILCIFGFPFWESFRSVLVNGGHLLLVDPSPDHLYELRSLIYDKVNTTDLNQLDSAFAAGFHIEREEKLSFNIQLKNNAQILDLLAMTPHGYRINQEAKERIAKVTQLETKASVVVRLLKAVTAL